RGPDLDTEIFDEPAPNAQLVDAVGHDDGHQEGKRTLARLLTEEREPQGVEAGTERITVQLVSREAGLEAFLADRPERLAETVDHRGRPGVGFEAPVAPVSGELAGSPLVAPHFGPAP